MGTIQLGLDVQAQPDTNPVGKDDSKIFTIVEKMPKYPGGDAALINHIQKTIQYPKVADEMDITGKVVVSYVVSKTGDVINVKIKQGVHPLLDAEALRVVRSLGKFTPGQQRGVPIPVLFTIPVNFTLQLASGSAQEHFDRAISLYKKGDNKKGDEQLDKAISLGSSWYIQAYITRAEKKLETGNYTDALQDMNIALTIDSTRSDLLVLRGLCLYVKRMLDEAKETLEKALKINPDSYKATYYLGMVCFDLGLYQDAESNFTATIESRYKEADVYVKRGKARAKLNNQAGACQDWKKAKELGNKEVNELLKWACK
jgi:TonB family protein